MSPPASSPAPNVDVKKEYVVVEEVAGSGDELSSAAKEAFKCLKLTVKSVFLVHHAPLQRAVVLNVVWIVSKRGRRCFEKRRRCVK